MKVATQTAQKQLKRTIELPLLSKNTKFSQEELAQKTNCITDGKIEFCFLDMISRQIQDFDITKKSPPARTQTRR